MGGLFLSNLNPKTNKMILKNLNDIDALILEGCTLKEYLSFFGEDPTEKAQAVNDILREMSLQDLKELISKRIKLAAEIIKSYSGAKKAKIISLDVEIDQKANELGATNLADYNNYIVSIFRASDQKIDKTISMLDFCNLENQVQEEYKMRVINENKRK